MGVEVGVVACVGCEGRAYGADCGEIILRMFIRDYVLHSSWYERHVNILNTKQWKTEMKHINTANTAKC